MASIWFGSHKRSLKMGRHDLLDPEEGKIHYAEQALGQVLGRSWSQALGGRLDLKLEYRSSDGYFSYSLMGLPFRIDTSSKGELELRFMTKGSRRVTQISSLQALIEAFRAGSLFQEPVWVMRREVHERMASLFPPPSKSSVFLIRLLSPEQVSYAGPEVDEGTVHSMLGRYERIWAIVGGGLVVQDPSWGSNLWLPVRNREELRRELRWEYEYDGVDNPAML